MRSGVALIKDEDDKLVGFLCINYDMTKASMLKDMGDFMMKTIPFPLKMFGLRSSAASEETRH